MKKNNSLKGKLDIIKIPYEEFLVSEKRTVRIYLPKSYRKNDSTTYDVIYMFDGQNLFDVQTATYYKEWKIDETISELENENIKPSIVVGIDSSKDRLSEYLPRFSNIAIGNLAYKGDITLSFLIDKVIPYVESHYKVKKTRNFRSIGGSSMGGLMALYASILYPNKFRYIYAFSCAFPIFKYGLTETPPSKNGLNNDDALTYVIDKLTDSKHLNKFKIALCAGGKGIEKYYTKYPNLLKKGLVNKNYNPEDILVYIDKNYEHDEYQWADFFKKAYKEFKLDEKKGNN